MKFSITLLVSALYLLSSVEAGISTTSPFNAVTWNGSETVKVTWDEDGTAPKLEEIVEPVTVELMVDPQLQISVTTIGTARATDKQISYIVPPSIGPPGDSYFIKYTAGTYTSFSGTFSIKNVNGNIPGFDPNNPSGPSNSSTTASPAAAPTQSSDPYASSTGTGSGYPAASPQNTNTPSGNTPASTSTPNSASNTSAGLTSLPSVLSSGVNNLVPSFASVATAVIALTFTYLY